MGEVEFRPAEPDDVPQIVAMLADDTLGAARESLDDLAPYVRAFTRINADPNQVVIVGEGDGEILATLQLTFITGLSHRGATRAQIEAVRVRSTERGNGLGSRLVAAAVRESRDRGCHIVQLTSNATRDGAHRFYERLGFVASHVGFKLPLAGSGV
ncbi:MAG: GNAT family N-acetyltransferase [Kutzneria sp.]|nr:GNAT family N-acetyltransferase [Kutzneria sp.]MBV9846987.1 GNAT family N-acetyltransferase [Kutzneria sp.]